MSGLAAVGATTGEPVGLRLSHNRRRLTVAGLFVGMFLAALDQTIVATALPTIVGDFGGLDRLSWVVTAYLLTSTGSTALYGALAERYGRLPVFAAATGLFVGGSVAGALAQSLYELVAFRALQGLGAGGLFVLSATLVSEVVARERRGRIQGALGAVFGLAVVAGPLAGGWLAGGHHVLGLLTSWRWVFWLNLPLGTVALGLVAAGLAGVPIPRRPHAIDWLGGLLVVAGVGLLLGLLVGAGQRPAWPLWQLAGSGAGSAILLTAFTLRQARAAEPMLPLRLFRVRTVALACGISFALGALLFGAVIFLPIYLQVVDGTSPAYSGVLLLPLLAGLVISSVVAGRVVSRLGRQQPLPVLGCALTGAGLWLLAQLDGAGSHTDEAVAMVVLGVGLGLVTQVLVAAVQDAADPADLGLATSTVTFFRTLGGAVGTALFGAVLYARVRFWLDQLLPSYARERLDADANRLIATPKTVRELPTGPGRFFDLQHPVIEAFVRGSREVFEVGLGFALVGVALAALLRSRSSLQSADRSADQSADQ